MSGGTRVLISQISRSVTQTASVDPGSGDDASTTSVKVTTAVQCGSDGNLAQCPLSGPILTHSSTCGAYTRDRNQTPIAGRTNPATYFLQLNPGIDVNKFNVGCGANPSMTIGDVLDEQSAATADTPVDNATSAMQNFVVTGATKCSAISDWYGDNGTGGPVNPKDAAIYDGSDMVSTDPVDTYLAKAGLDPMDVTTIATNCTSENGTHGEPDETVQQVLKEPTP